MKPIVNETGSSVKVCGRVTTAGDTLVYETTGGRVLKQIVSWQAAVDTVEGMVGAPVYLEHPSDEDMMLPGFRRLAKPIGTVLEAQLDRDGNANVMFALHDTTDILDIDTLKPLEHTQLSPGYMREVKDGVQVSRVIDHLSVVKFARGGHDKTIQFDSAEIKLKEENEKNDVISSHDDINKSEDKINMNVEIMKALGLPDDIGAEDYDNAILMALAEFMEMKACKDAVEAAEKRKILLDKLIGAKLLNADMPELDELGLINTALGGSEFADVVNATMALDVVLKMKAANDGEEDILPLVDAAEMNKPAIVEEKKNIATDSKKAATKAKLPEYIKDVKASTVKLLLDF